MNVKAYAYITRKGRPRREYFENSEPSADLSLFFKYSNSIDPKGHDTGIMQ